MRLLLDTHLRLVTHCVDIVDICTVEHLESLQWNLPNLDTNRAEESVIVSEVS